jgi:hypothetical protein
MVLDEEDGVEEDTEYIGLVDDAYSDADDVMMRKERKKTMKKNIQGMKKHLSHSGLKEVQEDVIFLLLSWYNSDCT